MGEPNCFICDCSLHEDESITTEKEKGIRTFIESSKKRGDNKHGYLQSLITVAVHEKCRKSYNKESSIKTAISGCNTRKEGKRSSEPQFNFKNNCVLCGENAASDFEKIQLKKNKELRDTVHQVTTLRFINSLTSVAENRGDEWGQQVTLRISNVSDLVAAEARYHGKCGKRFFTPLASSSTSRGRPFDDEVTAAINYISDYMEQNEDECQFNLDEILQDYTHYIPPVATIKKRLLDKYGEEILIPTQVGNQHRSTVICFKNTGYSILSDKWYTSRKNDKEEEGLRVARACGDYVRAEIQSKQYDLNNYPKPDGFLDNIDDDIPESLMVLLQLIIAPRSHRGKEVDDGVESKMAIRVKAIAHAIIAAARPRSFVSPLLVGLGAFLHRKYASRDLVDVLSALGFCTSYTNVRNFELSCVQQSQEEVPENCFSQFIFDNADFNVNTIDGLNSFHTMGGIQCITPKPETASFGNPIPKLKYTPKASVVGKLGHIPVTTFQKPANERLSSVMLINFEEKNALDSSGLSVTSPPLKSNEVRTSGSDLLWIYGKSNNIALPGWNGFMEKVYKDENYSTSRVLCLPFINAPPTNYDTVYTALLTAAEKCKRSQQKVSFVTFDQPLYIKARDIVAASSHNSDLKQVVVRLGGFHLLMSFMGTIGYVMDGSGLKELFGVIYAAASTDKILTGQAYSRALRAHILVHLVLFKIVLAKVAITDDEHSDLINIIVDIKNGAPVEIDVPLVRQVMQKVSNKLLELQKSGPTAKLWCQYLNMVTIVKLFVQAERSGDWYLHLQCIREMLPYFHGSGHFLYAKSAHLYLQDMHELKLKLSPAEYEQFVCKGYFTISRSEKFWSGIWSDMTIEQTLMRSMKSIGGMTHGRGITDSTIATWIHTMPIIMEISLQIENFCGVSFASTEQHVDTRTSRISRDESDADKLSTWLLSISTGVVEDNKINCHIAHEVGCSSLSKMSGMHFHQIKFKRKDRVLSLRCVTSKIKIHDEDVPVNPDTIFRRIAFHKKTDADLKKYFEYELSPYPLSIFNEVGMRKTRKSILYELFNPEEINLSDLKDTVAVIDGGFLLHRVPWQTGEMFSVLIDKYIKYVKQHHGECATIVFDGYLDLTNENGIKSAERERRSRKLSAVKVVFDEGTPVTMTKERFLSNEHNKQRLITMLTEKLLAQKFEVKQAVEDADSTIINTALQIGQQSRRPVIIVGEDVDLLILLTAATPASPNVYLLKPGKGKQPDTLYSPKGFKHSDTVKKNILFVHAFSGCDSTSAMFRQGKLKFVKVMEKYTSLQDAVAVFSNTNATPDQVDRAGQQFIAFLYSGSANKSLNEIRYELFSNVLVKKEFNLASLPPTEAAARQHSLRTHLQIEMWKGNNLDPLTWGWKTSKYGLRPLATAKDAAPVELVNSIFCKCTKGCRRGCTFKKNGITCTNVCKGCKGQSCTNSPTDGDEMLINSDSINSEEDIDDLIEQTIFDLDNEKEEKRNEEEYQLKAYEPPFKKIKSVKL